jgi:hypothetical protein
MSSTDSLLTPAAFGVEPSFRDGHVPQIVVPAAGALVGDELLSAYHVERPRTEICLGASVPGPGEGHPVDLVQDVDAPWLSPEHPDASWYRELLDGWDLATEAEGQQGFTKPAGVCQRGVDEDVEILRQSWFAVGRHRVSPYENEANALRD